MKKLLTILCLVLLVSCSNEVPPDTLVDRQGIKYEVNSTTPFTGQSVSYDRREVVVERIGYKNGKREGLSKKFFQNNQLEYRKYYKDGKLHGLKEEYYKNGQLKTKENYKHGKKHGFLETSNDWGRVTSRDCYKTDEKVDMSYCEK